MSIATISPRRGIGLIFFLVALLLFLLLLVALHRAFFAGTLVDEVAASQRSELALTLAESALEELQLTLRKSVNDPASPVFPVFREPMKLDPSTGFSVPITDDWTRRTRVLTADPTYRPHGFKLSVFPPRMLFQKLFDDGIHNYGEYFGSLAYEVCVESTQGKPRVKRDLRATQDVKVIAAVMPPPFDQISVLLAEASPVLGGPEVNRTSQYFSDVRDSYLKFFQDVTQKQGAAAQGAQEIEKLIAYFEAIPAFVKGKQLSEYAPEVVHEMLFPMIAFARPAYIKDHDITGEEIDLALSLKGWRDEVDRLDSEARKALAPVSSASAGTRPTQAQAEAVERALKALAEKLYESQQRINRWQTIFGELIQSSQKNLARDFSRLAADQLRKKAFLVVNAAGSLSATAAFDQARAGLKARTGSDLVNGVVFVDNQASELDLSEFQARGRVIFYVTGAVRVRNTRRAGDQDHVSVIAAGAMTIEGNITASLAAMGTYTLKPPVILTGSLLLKDPRPGTLAGLTIRHDPHLSALDRSGSGRYDPRYFYVGISPQLSTKQL